MDSNSTSNKKSASITGVKKRQQIKNANQMTFIWIIIASAAVALCLVTAQFLVRQALFNQKVINEQSSTQSTLAQNLKNYNSLKKEVEKLVANSDLAKVKANESDTAYKVVLDALPVSNDETVLGSSLLQVVLPKSGVSIISLKTGVDQNTGNASEESTTETTTPFEFQVQSNYSQTLTMLSDMERSIRPINVKSLTIQGSDSTMNVTVKGESYYSPEKSVELKKKVVKP